jgi:PKD repeat protein
MAIGFLAGCPGPTDPSPKLSDDAGLGSLALDQGITLEPGFDPDTLAYTATVPYTVEAVRATAEPNHPNAAVDNPAAEGKALSVGSNTIAIIVTAEDGASTKTYTIAVARQAEKLSDDATLKSLSLGEVALDPAFDPDVTEYAAEVEFGVSSIAVTAEPGHPNATVDNSAAEGQALAVGGNAVTITVTAEDGATTKIYTVTVTRAVDITEARLGSLAIDHGALQPVFDPDTLEYTASVLYAVETITVTAQAAQEGATVDNPGATGKALDVGSNAIRITVTALDGTTTKTYAIAVARQAAEYQPSNDATLKALSLGDCALSPAFAPGTTEYTAAVESGVSSVAVIAEPSDSNATAVVSANASSLVPGQNTIAIAVTAEDETTVATYTVIVTRAMDARLGSLAIDQGTLQPGFDPDTLAYTASVPHTVGTITVTAQAAQSGVTVNNPAASGTALTVGSNTITITATAADGTSSKTYAITVTRQEESYQPSNDAALKTLSLSAGSLSPAFASGTTSYTASVEFGVSSVTVTAEPNDPNATAANPAATGMALTVGSNTITITVTAEDGTTRKTYTLTITRQPEAYQPSNDATLKALALGGGASLSPAFAPGTTAYTAAVENDVTSVAVAAEASHPNATAAINGGQALTVGSNTITIAVTAEDRTTTKTYTITVARREYEAARDATLKALSLDGVALSPIFAPGTTSYAASVESGISSVTVTAEPEQSGATALVAGGQALNPGGNSITITVTAPNGTTTKRYAITVIRAPAAPVVRVKEGTTKLTVEWDPTPGATAYEVWYGHNGTSQYTPPPPQQSGGDLSGTEISHVITGLEEHEVSGFARPDIGWFKVLVYTKNSAGRSPAAEWNGDLVKVDLLRHVTASLISDGAVELTYSDYGVNSVGQYRSLYVSLEDDPETAEVALEIFSGPSMITGLTNGLTYYFWMRRLTAAGGVGDWSNSVSFTPRISTPQITQTIPGNAQIWVEWGSIASASSYEVWRYETALGPETAQKTPGEILSDPAVILYSRTIEGLTNGTEYTVYVKAKSEYDSADSLKLTATPRTVPGTPVISGLTPGVGQIMVSWGQIPTAASYEILYSTANNSSQALKYGEILDPNTSAAIKGLAHNTAYYVWLRAKNDQGSGILSAPMSGTTLASGAITVGVGLDGELTVKDGNGTDVSGGFALGASGSVTLSVDGGFADVAWHVDGSPSAGDTITLNGASYSSHRDHSVTFTGKKGGILYSSKPIPFRVASP